MRVLLLLSLSGLALGQAGPTAAPSAAPPAPVRFNRDVRPILSDTCFKCHGPDAKGRKGDLRLDVKSAAFGEIEGRRIITPGSLEKSELWKRVVAEDELEEGQNFRNAYEESKYQAERLVRRAASFIPVSVFRPASVVGDSRTGEIDRFEGPYYLGLLLVMSPLMVPIPLPGTGVAHAAR